MKLNTKKIIYVGFAFLIIQLFWQVYDTVIAKMLIDSFGLNQFWSGVVMAVDNILAVILLPVFGALSDKTKTKHGKRTPYIFIGTVVAALIITGVSIFDNLQNNKIKEANIPGIVTVEVKNIEEKEITILGYNDDKQEEITVTIDGETINYYDTTISTVYKFDYDKAEIKYFEVKEDATIARSPFVAEIRNQNIGFLIGFLAVLFIVLVAMSVFRTPAVSLMPDVTPKPLRSKGNAIINLMGAAGGIIALVYMTFTNKDYQSYLLSFVVLSVLMIVFLVIFLINVNENKLVQEKIEEEKLYNIEDEVIEEVSTEKLPKDVRRSFILILLSVVFWYMAYNAATSKFSVYATNVLDTGYTMPLLVAQGAAIISYIPIGVISSKIGRKKTVIAGVIILFAAFFLAIFVNENSALLIWAALALAGIGWATINVNSYPMIVEMATGNNVGKYTGIYYTASMAAQIVTPILSGFFMDIFGMQYTLFIYSTIFSGLALVTMIFVKHGDSKPIPKDALSSFEDLGD